LTFLPPLTNLKVVSHAVLFFKHLHYCLAAPLVIIFTQLLSVAFFPDEWKRAIIVPIHKKGSAKPSKVISNYRPISVTCVTAKIFICPIAIAYMSSMGQITNSVCLCHSVVHKKY